MWTRFWIWLQTTWGLDPRGLFIYFDGFRWRSVDPLQVARQLFTHPEFDWDETPQLLLTGRAPVQLEAFRIIGDAIRSVLRIRPAEQGGLTDRECLDVLTAFRQYMGDVKKNGSLFPISPDSTGSVPVDKLDTKAGSACGSMGIDPSTERPGSQGEPTSTA